MYNCIHIYAILSQQSTMSLSLVSVVVGFRVYAKKGEKPRHGKATTAQSTLRTRFPSVVEN